MLVRPSYVLGGRAMAIVYDEHELEGYIREAVEVTPDAPVLIDRFLEDAFEMDVDAICGWHGRGDRRDYGADRAGRRALGRLGLRAAHLHGRAGAH